MTASKIQKRFQHDCDLEDLPCRLPRVQTEYDKLIGDLMESKDYARDHRVVKFKNCLDCWVKIEGQLKPRQHPERGGNRLGEKSSPPWGPGLAEMCLDLPDPYRLARASDFTWYATILDDKTTTEEEKPFCRLFTPVSAEKKQTRRTKRENAGLKLTELRELHPGETMQVDVCRESVSSLSLLCASSLLVTTLAAMRNGADENEVNWWNKVRQEVFEPPNLPREICGRLESLRQLII